MEPVRRFLRTYTIHSYVHKGPKSACHRNIGTAMSIAVLVTITKKWDHPTHCQHMCQHKCQHKIPGAHAQRDFVLFCAALRKEK